MGATVRRKAEGAAGCMPAILAGSAPSHPYLRVGAALAANVRMRSHKTPEGAGHQTLMLQLTQNPARASKPHPMAFASGHIQKCLDDPGFPHCPRPAY